MFKSEDGRLLTVVHEERPLKKSERRFKLSIITSWTSSNTDRSKTMTVYFKSPKNYQIKKQSSISCTFNKLLDKINARLTRRRPSLTNSTDLTI